MPRFNERFTLSLANCPNCLFLDDELNILKISSFADKIEPIATVSEENKALTNL